MFGDVIQYVQYKQLKGVVSDFSQFAVTSNTHSPLKSHSSEEMSENLNIQNNSQTEYLYYWIAF